MELPKGSETLEDFILVDHLLRDPIFLESIESTDGKLWKVFADWKRDRLVYEFVNGTVKESSLSLAIKRLKDLKYLTD